ncbi:response regulator [Salinimicrobium tongyeongense]|uniref:Response regulator n=1 Tax=Salinimicrobium tongyeongense TaxID=2809707 RepID=A0ABY6NP83_9FLAO|nr:response regulator [Salinimicrobium tongyeongense]UZH54707.1 response regulator [Salinimicrobium tongyeongense]
MENSVLLIEDDLVLAENTRELLELSGYRTFLAHEGKTGLKKAYKELPDIIISDIMMPELDGYEVYTALQQNRHTRNIPFIFLSAKSNPADVRRGMNLGADDYITKPFSEEDLILTIEKRLAKRAQLQGEKSPGRKNQLHLEEFKEYVRTYGEQLEADKNEEIFMENRMACSVYLLEHGLVKTFRLDEYGKELITAIPQKGDFLGFYSYKNSTHYPESALALEKSILYRLSHDEFVQMLEQNRDLMLEFAEEITHSLDVLRTHLLEMAYGSVLKKTASTLLEFAEKISGNNTPVLKVSRSDMASVAGISTESFIRSLSCLKKDGVIDIIGRDIKILELEKLREIH